MDSFAFHIQLEPKDPWADIAIALLSERGFNAFEETETGIIAYTDQVSTPNLMEEENQIENWATENHIKCKVEVVKIPQQNWNAIWESDFHPVYVEDKLTIVAPFHEKPKNAGMVIEIQPQMSFGTGHHQTTWMMSKAMLDFGSLPSEVLDMGTGTGILAILAEKLGAQEILAIDIEEWSAQNAKENAGRNGCGNIKTLHGDVDLIADKKFGLILANINKNVLTAQLPHYSNSLLQDGYLMLSGFFETDCDELLQTAKNFGFSLVKKYNRETWAAMLLQLN